MSINRLYDMWFQQVRQLWPNERITLARNLAWFLAGLYLSRSVQLPRVAGKIPSGAKLPSLTRRLSRLLANPRIRTRAWYEPLARSLLHAIASTLGEIRLIADGTTIGRHHQWLMISIAFRRRAVPLAWTWVQQRRGHTSAFRQLALLAYVQRLLPQGMAVILVGDSELGAVEVLQQLEAWNWHYVLRQTAKHLVQPAGQTDWPAFGSLVRCRGEQVWLTQARLTVLHAPPTNLLAHWGVGEKQPWLLATNLPGPQLALRAYRRRMWIDEMFGDLKGHGFEVASTHLEQVARLARLTLLVVLLYRWLLAVGTHTIKRGVRHLVDRKERRDLSLFQIGLRLVERHLVNAHPVSIRLHPYFR